MRPVTALGRVFDPRLPSNRFVLATVLVAGVLALILPETVVAGDRPRLVSAVVVAAATGLAWTLGREIDPDHNATAALAAVATGVFELAVGGVSLGATYAAMVTARIVARTTGAHATPIDLGAHVVVAGVLGAGTVTWPAGALIGVGVVLTTRLPRPAPATHLWWGAAIGAVALIVAGFLREPAAWTRPTPLLWTLIGTGVIGAMLLGKAVEVTSVGDYTGKPLQPERVTAARLLVLAGAIVISVAAGGVGVAASAAAWLCLLAGGLVAVASR
jgi:hypothetical protein